MRSGTESLIAVVGCVVGLILVQRCDARVEPISLPRTLQGYLDTCKSTGDLTQHNGESVFWSSMQLYMTEFVKRRPSMSQAEINFLRQTVANEMGVIPTSRSGRLKRQAVQPRLRKEIRAMTTEERVRYFNALNALKHDTRLRPNIYDVLAGFHSGANVARAHFGPAFPSWHRLYLYLFESFLRLHDPSVTIPYWASDLDNDMADPAQSVIWSDAFFGPGVGLPVSGPFRAWQRANSGAIFTRNVGGSGQLYTYDGIQRILRRTRNRDILMPTARPDSNFELQHGAPHTFISGTQNNLQRAAFDPIFFSHHAYVDQIWERFRFGQRNAGIATETDYPWDPNDRRFRPQHNPEATTGFFPNGELNIPWIQRTGYSDAFFRIVQYEPVPQCQTNCNDSPFLFCNNALRPQRCVSRTIQDVRSRSPALVDQLPGLLPTGTAPRVRRQARVQRAVYDQNVCPRRTFLNDIDVDMLEDTSSGGNDWVYVPIKVVTKRAFDYKPFGKYSLYQIPLSDLGEKTELAKPTIQKKYPSCDKMQDAVGRIKITAFGLNYEGYSEEIAIVDNRLGVSESTAYIPIKTPMFGSQTEVVINAFDSCGRVCKPHCNASPGGNMTPFAGAVRVSTDRPLQYGRSYGESMLDIWTVPGQNACPNIAYNRIPISFFCEFTDTWIWDSKSSQSQLPINMFTGIPEIVGPNVFPQQGQWGRVQDIPRERTHGGGNRGRGNERVGRREQGRYPNKRSRGF